MRSAEWGKNISFLSSANRISTLQETKPQKKKVIFLHRTEIKFSSLCSRQFFCMKENKGILLSNTLHFAEHGKFFKTFKLNYKHIDLRLQLKRKLNIRRLICKRNMFLSVQANALLDFSSTKLCFLVLSESNLP